MNCAGAGSAQFWTTTACMARKNLCLLPARAPSARQPMTASALSARPAPRLWPTATTSPNCRSSGHWKSPPRKMRTARTRSMLSSSSTAMTMCAGASTCAGCCRRTPTRKNGMRAVIAISKCAATPVPGMKRGRRVRIKTALSTATLQTRSMLPDLTATASSAVAVAVRPSTIPATATMWVCGASAAHSMRAHPADCSNGSLP